MRGKRHLGVVMAAQRLHLPQAALDGLAVGRVLLEFLVGIVSRHLWGVISRGKGAVQEHQAGLVSPEDVVDENQADQSSCKINSYNLLDLCNAMGKNDTAVVDSSGRQEGSAHGSMVIVLHDLQAKK